MGVGTATDG